MLPFAMSWRSRSLRGAWPCKGPSSSCFPRPVPVRCLQLPSLAVSAPWRTTYSACTATTGSWRSPVEQRASWSSLGAALLQVQTVGAIACGPRQGF